MSLQRTSCSESQERRSIKLGNARIDHVRVSTIDRSLGLQVDAMRKYGVDRIYEGRMIGMRFDRPAFRKMDGYLLKGDVVVICKLDRLGRSTKHLIELVEN